VSVLTHMEVRVEFALIFINDAGVSVEADMQFISHSIHLHKYHCRRFTDKVALQERDHGGKSTVFRNLAPSIKNIR
jgi:hypothetical protein